MEQTTEVTLKYKFIPDVENSDTPDNDAVTITINPGGSAGDVISNTTSISTTGRTTVGGDGHGIVVVDESDDPNDGFRTLRFTTNNPEALKKNQTIRISGEVGGVTGKVVYRDVTYYLMERQNMAVSCSPTSVEDVMGQQVNVNIGIPKDLPESMFPLVFNIEAEKLSITPYISSEWADENLPVESGKTLVPGKSYPSFHYKRTLSYEEYTGTGLYAGKGLPDGTGGVVMTCHFKTNKDQSDSNIYVTNDYFNEGSTAFANYHMYDFTKMYFSDMALTSAGTAVTYHFNMDDADTANNRQIIVTLDGLVPDGTSQLTQVMGSSNRYYYTAANASNTLNLKTESGFNGVYSVKLETSGYHMAERVNSNFVQHTVTLSASNLTAGVSAGQNQSEGWSISDGETIRLSFSNLNSVGSYYANYLELNQNSTMTIECSAPMSQIQFTYYSESWGGRTTYYGQCSMGPNVGSYERNSNTSGTWTGSASTVTITVGSQVNNTRNRITGLQITYWTYDAS